MTILESQSQIVQEFKIFDNWFDKYNYLIKLGKDLPPIDLKLKTDDNLIKGCQVKTWFRSTYKNGKMFYDIDSSSLVIRGMIVLLRKVFSGQSPEDISNSNLKFIDQIGLEENFLPTRANSLFKMVSQIKSDALTRTNKK